VVVEEVEEEVAEEEMVVEEGQQVSLAQEEEEGEVEEAGPRLPRRQQAVDIPFIISPPCPLLDTAAPSCALYMLTNW
jgi:hypothetical protein